MRKAALLSFAIAFLLLATRLFTGLTYAHDSPVTSLVLKSPGMAFEFPEASRASATGYAIYSADPTIPFQSAYIALMKASPVLTLITVIAGCALVISSRSTARKRD